jgi:hypothetical protein
MTADIKIIDTTVGRLLDKHKPDGAQWVVYIDDDGFRSCYGTFESYDDAQTWMGKHHLAHMSTGYGVEVLPLYMAT